MVFPHVRYTARTLCLRRSAITFDLGAAGIRVCQLRQRGGEPTLCDALQLEGMVSGEGEQPAAPAVDPAQLDRLIGRGSFAGRELTLVLSPPEVEFFPLRLPAQALAQTPDRIERALKWEVAQESRNSAEELEVRYWSLPVGRAGQNNVMAVVMPCQVALRWCSRLGSHGLTLRRIDVSPCALVRLSCRLWTPTEQDLWGVLDLGLRHSTLTVVVGTVPTYIRSLSVCAHHWTQQLAAAFEVSYPVAEQLKREHGVRATERGLRASSPGGNLLQATDLPSALSSVLRKLLQRLAKEVGRCFSYVMQSYPDLSVRRLVLAGGGAGLGGLPAVFEAGLGVPVSTLASGKGDQPPQWDHPLPNLRLEPLAAAALGGALCDLEAS